MSNEPAKEEGKKKTSTGKKVLYGVGVFFLLIVLARACGGGKDRNPGANTAGNTSSHAASTPAIEMSAAELVEAYEANEVGADEKYKGKDLVLNGRIDNIGKDLLDNMYVAFKSEKQFDFREAQCFFDDDHKKALASLGKGQRIKIRGTCTGMMGMVHLENCVIVPDAAPATTN